MQFSPKNILARFQDTNWQDKRANKRNKIGTNNQILEEKGAEIKKKRWLGG
jgi:hypothetical protein